MAKTYRNPSSNIRSNGMRNLRSAGSSAAKFTGRTAEKSVVGLASWATTDHSGMGRALSNIPSMGLLDTLGYIIKQFLIAVAGAVLSGALVFLLIAFGIPLLIAIIF